MKTTKFLPLLFCSIMLMLSVTAFKFKTENEENKNQVQTNNPKSRKEVLQSMIGEHQLNQISALMGANTMVSFHPEQGEWSGSGSSLSMGQREAYNMEISAEQRTMLKNCKIVVENDLSVHFVVNGKKLLSVPFNEKSMMYSVSQPITEVYTLPGDISPNTNFVENELYLALTDKFDPIVNSFAEIPGVISEIIFLSCNAESKSFQMIITGYSFGGGTATLSF
jgi:hypothetical protein